MNKWANVFKDDLWKFEEATKQFFAKEIKPNDYKTKALGFGAVGERGANSIMIRLRFTGGTITKEELEALASIVEDFQLNMLHFTTGQTFQFHHLGPDKAIPLMRAIYDRGLVSRGSGSDYPNNVTAPSLRGFTKDEYFDLVNIPDVANDYLLGKINHLSLPRKVKTAFSNGPSTDSLVRFRDMGFVGRLDGLFDFFTLGGIGPNPQIGVKTAEAIEPADILYYIEAFLQTYVSLADFKARSRNRSRYLQKSPGLDTYLERFGQELAKVYEKDLSYTFEPTKIRTISPNDTEVLVDTKQQPRIHKQKQDGLYYVTYHPLGGMISGQEFLAFAKTVLAIDGALVRLGGEETLYIANLTTEEALAVNKVTASSGTTAFERSVACVGSKTCQIGVRDSQELLASILEAARPYQFADGVLPQIYISGCSNSCGTHEIGELGFHGFVKLVDKKPQAAFSLHFGGSEHLGTEKFGQQMGVLLTEDIPSFIIDLGKAVSLSGLTFTEWIKGHTNDFQDLLKPYL